MRGRRSRGGISRFAPSIAALALLLGVPGSARAEDPRPAPDAEGEATDPAVRDARAEFVRGAAFVKSAQWAEALAAFERSSRLVPHSITTFNIGACERALGLYTRARQTLARAREEAARSGHEDPAFAASVRTYLGEVEQLVARVPVQFEPADATIAVDGRPLAREPSARAELVAGVLPPGQGSRADANTFTLLVDPGSHVVTVTREGFGELVVTPTFKPGTNATLTLELSKLPASLRVAADRPGAVVRIDRLDVGIAPVDISRPAGTYDVVVQKEGFLTYQSRVTLRAGEHANLLGKLEPRHPSLTERWWFWTAVGGVLTTTAVATYLLARPAPERPPIDGGGLGWGLQVP